MTRPDSQPSVPSADLKSSFSLPLRWFSALVLLAALLVSRPAPAQTIDDDYIAILNTIQQADALSAQGRTDEALTRYRNAQATLFNFRKINPDYHIKVVSFRMNYLADKLAPPPAKVAAPAENATETSTSSPAPAPKAANTARAAAGPQIKLLEAGAEPRTVLRLQPKAGDKQNLEMTMTIGMGFQAGEMNNPAMKLPPIKMPMEVTVQSVSPEGDIAYDMVMGEATLGEQAEAAPQPAAEVMKASLAGLKGVTGSGTISNRGLNKGTQIKASATIDAQTRQALEQTREMFSQAVVVLPEEAVGPGAKWEVQLPLKSQGMTIHQTTTYELVSLQDGRLTAKATVEQTAANQKIQNPAMPGLKVDLNKMTGHGTGDLTLDLAKPLPSAANMDSHSEVTMGMNVGGQKQSMMMKMDLNVRIEAK